jgi:hypothetical protein
MPKFNPGPKGLGLSALQGHAKESITAIRLHHIN